MNQRDELFGYCRHRWKNMLIRLGLKIFNYVQVIYGIETLLLCVIIFISVVFSLKISFSNYETNLYEIHNHQICNLLKYCNL